MNHKINQNSKVYQSVDVKAVRLILGLTQEQFAAKLGVTFPTVNRWENNKTTPSPLAQQKLNKLLKTLLKESNRS